MDSPAGCASPAAHSTPRRGGTVGGASSAGVTEQQENGHAPLDERSGVLVGLAAYLLWGFLTVYWKQLAAFDALELIGWRMTTAAVVMSLLMVARGRGRRIWAAFRSSSTVTFLVVAALLLAANWGSYVWAVVNDRVIETALGYFIAPLLTMAIGVTVLGETPTAAQRVAFVLAAIAVVVLTISYGRPPWIALLLAATWSLYGLTKRRVPLDAVDSLTGETLVLAAPAAVLLLVVGTGTTSAIEVASTREWGFLLGTGLITAIPLMLFAAAAQSIPFTLLGPLNLLVPVINFGLGWLVYDESMPADRIIGFAFVWVALVVVMWDRIRSARSSGRTTRPVAAH